VFEANEIFDTPDGDLRKKESILRVRQSGDETVLTWKGPTVDGRHRARPEEETTVGNGEALKNILRMTGFGRVFRYEKYRTEFRRGDSDLFVTLDETPIGTFLELEGPPGEVDRIAHELGFQEQQYVTASYGKLYLDECARSGVVAGNMVFQATEEKS
jgi:adenylate cyclase class 2